MRGRPERYWPDGLELDDPVGAVGCDAGVWGVASTAGVSGTTHPLTSMLRMFEICFVVRRTDALELDDLDVGSAVSLNCLVR